MADRLGPERDAGSGHRHRRPHPTHGISYTKFLDDVAAKQIKTITIKSNGQASGTLGNGHKYDMVIPVDLAGPSLLDRLRAAKVTITASNSG